MSKKFSTDSEELPKDDKGEKGDKKETGDKGDLYLRGEYMAMDYTQNGKISTKDFVDLLRYLGEPSREKIMASLKKF